jgi:hypothetical protein
VETLIWIAIVVGTAVTAGAVLVGFWLIGRAADPVRQFAQARDLFRGQREHLEAQFFEAATRSGKPRGLRWLECIWGEAVAFARDKETRQFVALVSVTIRFEAIEGSDMEGLPAVANLRNASAVFFFHAGRWHTQGKAVFNLNPDEALRHFAGQYDPLAG